MKFKKILLGLITSFIMAMPFVLADIKGPSPVVVNGLLVLAIGIVGGFILGAFFLIRMIIRKIKNKK